jgi:hypothetical protein
VGYFLTVIARTTTMVGKTLLCCVPIVFGFVLHEFAMYLFLSNACYNQTPAKSFQLNFNQIQFPIDGRLQNSLLK